MSKAVATRAKGSSAAATSSAALKKAAEEIEAKQAEESNFQLSIKYRPQTLEDFLAPPEIKSIAKSIIGGKRDVSAALITGSTGSGKTTLAKIIAYAINRLPYGHDTFDFHYMNAGDQRGVDDARNLRAYYTRVPQRKKIVILIDEVHALTGQAASAILTPLEEPRKNRIFLLCTDQPEKLLPTIVNRCVPMHLSLPDPKELAAMMRDVIAQEKALKSYSAKDVKKLSKAIVEAGGGTPRACLQLLETCIDGASDFKNAKELIKGPLLKTPTAQLDGLAIKIVVSLVKLYTIGESKAKADERMEAWTGLTERALSGMTTVDNFALINRIANLVDAITTEMVSGDAVPAAWPLKKAAQGFGVKLWPMPFIAMLPDIIGLKVDAAKFMVNPSSLLLNCVLKLGHRFAKIED